MLKKYIVCCLLSVSSVGAFSQMIPNIGRSYQYTDQNGITQNVYSPSPGVFIKNPVGQSGSAQPSTVSTDPAQNKVSDPEKEKVPESLADKIKALSPEDKKKILDTIMNKPAKKLADNKVKAEQRPIGQVEINNTVVVKNISSWNKGTINDFQKEGEEDLQNGYKNFLKK